MHHVPGWVHGSPSDAAMCLLCGAHLSQIGAGHYQVTMNDGIPHVIPPRWLGPARTPIRNTYCLDEHAAAALGDQLTLTLGIPHGRQQPAPGTS